MKTYKFRIYAKIYEDVEIEADNEEEAREKFDDEHGEKFTQDWETDGLPSAVLLNPDNLEGCSMYDVTITVKATVGMKVSATDAEEAAEKAKYVYEMGCVPDAMFDKMPDEAIHVVAVNEDDDEDQCDLTP